MDFKSYKTFLPEKLKPSLVWVLQYGWKKSLESSLQVREILTAASIDLWFLFSSEVNFVFLHKEIMWNSSHFWPQFEDLENDSCEINLVRDGCTYGHLELSNWHLTSRGLTVLWESYICSSWRGSATPTWGPTSSKPIIGTFINFISIYEQQ